MPSNLYKETVSEILQVLSKNRQVNWGWTKATSDICARTDISATAKIVLYAMAIESKGSGYICMSDQAIATAAGCSRPQAFECRRKLEEAKLIEKRGEKIAQIQPYKILHPDLVKESASGAELPAAAPTTARTQRTSAGSVTCPECGQLRRKLLKAGRCRKCQGKRETRQIVQDEIRRHLPEKTA